MKKVAMIALAFGVSNAHAAKNNFECFAPEQDAGIALFTRDLRVFNLVRAGKTTKLRIDRTAVRPVPAKLTFEGDSVRLELTFENESALRADGILTGLAEADAPVHWICARQLYGP